MKIKILVCAMAMSMLLFVGCAPEDIETGQDNVDDEIPITEDEIPITEDDIDEEPIEEPIEPIEEPIEVEDDKEIVAPPVVEKPDGPIITNKGENTESNNDGPIITNKDETNQPIPKNESVILKPPTSK